jgi:HEPN domain-containing protein
MNRAQFKKLAHLRLKEAKILLDNGQYSGAYYLCGYVIEYALKAYYSKNIKRSQFPDLKAVQAMYKHRPDELIKAAGLYNKKFEDKKNKDKVFQSYWKIVSDWSEESRYYLHSPQKALDLYEAVSNSKNGILKWIEKYW